MKHSIGIDLGTTHAALAACPLDADRSDGASGSVEDAVGTVSVLDIPQLVTRGAVEPRSLLPSFLYFAHASEGPLALPWDAGRDFAVGEYARARAAEAPSRVVSSAKSWLCHPGIDRRAPCLPPSAPEDIDKVSPVEASWRYLDHLADVWRQQHGEHAALAEESIVLAVPASFDAAARDLTVEAAYLAGMEDVTLIEEPQAALYAWIDSVGDEWRELLGPGDLVLVVDVGGGTTDFSLIACVEAAGSLELHRVAVGDHILLGGDNMDLTLAHLVRQKLTDTGRELDAWQMSALTHACRAAKERLLGDTQESRAPGPAGGSAGGTTGAAATRGGAATSGALPDTVPVVVPSRGAQLLGGSLRAELTREEVHGVLIDGFFPVVGASARPATRPRAGLQQRGLPYAADAAITRHLASFLSRQAGAVASVPGLVATVAGASIARPTALLFNGGVVKGAAIRERLVSTLNAWLEADGAAPVRVLPSEDLDHAVARGACFYGLVRRGRGLRIRGGTARAYYVGIESPAPAVPGLEPPIVALCVAPFGVEEGSTLELPPHELGLVVGEPVRFRFFGSSVRRQDAAGAELERWGSGELEELSPIEVTLPAERRRAGELVAVRLAASVTAIGTLLLEAVPIEPLDDGERWKLELGVRG